MPTDPRRVKELFVAALDLPDLPARHAFLDHDCGADAELRGRLEVLLAAHEQPESCLARPLVDGPVAPGDALTADQSPSPASGAAGSVIAGRYKLLECIGEGGMGAVWVAEQREPVKRLVALKLIRAGMDSKGVLARFEAERQALAMMDHPNIARVLDAGATADGRPFFVMELVRGVPITRFCDDRRLSPRERLVLFIPVCRAIQHAHQKGLIHRDIKPSNVLVALYDDRPVPKVIDFGVAKAAGQALTEATFHTAFGSVVGTPEYMSPEQATFNQLDIDTRSDVYSLGVLLYELLTGATPVDRERLGQAAVLEVLRLVREEEPPRPSVRLSTAEARASIAATRGTEPERLARLLRGELDWVVMKALEKDRSRRYESAAAFARDVERYLADEVVDARPPTPGYRLRKFLRKNRQLAGATAAVLFVLIGMSGVATAYWLEARVAARAARAERDRAVKALEAEQAARRAMAFHYAQALATAQALESLVNWVALDQPGTDFRSEFLARLGATATALGANDHPADPLTRAALLHLIGATESNMGEYRRGAARLEAVLADRRRLLGNDHADTLETVALLGEAYRGAAQVERAIELLEPAVASAEARYGRGAREGFLPTFMLATAYSAVGRLDESFRLFERILETARPQSEPESARLVAEMNRAVRGWLGGNWIDRANRLQERVLELARQRLPAGHPDRVVAIDQLARCYRLNRKPAQAIPLLQELVAARRTQRPAAVWDLSVALGMLGISDLEADQAADAEPVLRESLALAEQSYPTATSMPKICLGCALARQGKLAEAEPLMVSGYSGLQGLRPKDQEGTERWMAEAAGHMVALNVARGKAAEADTWRSVQAHYANGSTQPPKEAAK